MLVVLLRMDSLKNLISWSFPFSKTLFINTYKLLFLCIVYQKNSEIRQKMKVLSKTKILKKHSWFLGCPKCLSKEKYGQTYIMPLQNKLSRNLFRRSHVEKKTLLFDNSRLKYVDSCENFSLNITSHF